MSYTDTWPTGQCTWRVALYYMIPWSGNALSWAAGAQANGWEVGSAPHVGDIAVFQPGDNGAQNDGHVAVVTQVNSDNTYRVYEQNVTFGTAAPDFRTVQSGTGTQFITPPTSARTNQFSTLFPDSAAVGGPASAQLALDPNPLDLFGIPQAVGQGVTGFIGGIVSDVFTFVAKAGEVVFGVILLAFGAWVLVRQSDTGKSVTNVIKSGVKAGATAAEVAG